MIWTSYKHDGTDSHTINTCLISERGAPGRSQREEDPLVFSCRRGLPHTPRLLAHFNFTLNWTSKRCLISAYQRQPAALRYAHLSRFVCLPLQQQAWQSSYHSSPSRSRSRKELVSEKWWVIQCWYWRGESWWSGDSSSESESMKRDASVRHSHVHHKLSTHTHKPSHEMCIHNSFLLSVDGWI